MQYRDICSNMCMYVCLSKKHDDPIILINSNGFETSHKWWGVMGSNQHLYCDGFVQKWDLP